MSGKKLAVFVVAIVIAASLLSVISVQLFFKFYEPKVNQTESSIEAISLTPVEQHFIITLNSR